MYKPSLYPLGLYKKKKGSRSMLYNDRFLLFIPFYNNFFIVNYLWNLYERSSLVKKILLVLVAALFFGIQAVNAFDFESVNVNNQVVYTPQSQTWSLGGMAEDRIVLTKKMSVGSGGYSEYYYSNGNLASALSSNFEFVHDGKLIAVNNAELKYNEIIYENDKFVEKALTPEDMEKIFPGIEVVKISQFQNGEITITKPWFDKKTILLFNDTNLNFYKYSFKPQNVKETFVTGLITLKRIGKITFSHYGETEGMLTIIVKNK